jgi:hypothetical protein
MILSILPAYLPPLSDAINWDSVPRDFEYTLVIVYLLKQVHTIRANHDKLVVLKFSNFNLDDRKVYNMLTPHKYLMRTKGKNSKITPQSWTQNLAQPTHVVYTMPLSAGTPEIGDKQAQLHRIADTVEARLRWAQEETMQATQALVKAQEDHLEQRSTVKRKKLTLQERFDKEKSQLHKEKEQLLVEKLEIKEMVHRALRYVTIIEVEAEEWVPL